MKSLTLTLIICCCIIGKLTAQDWRLLQHERVPLFASDFDSIIIAAIQFDSTTFLANGDSLLWNYRTELPCNCSFSNIPGQQWLYINNRCSVRDTGWLGLPVIKHTNDYKFINYKNDTFLLKPNAQLYEVWKFTTLPNGNYIEATVTSMSTASIFGNLDSIKRITLNFKTSTGTIIPNNWISNYYFIFSKNNGLIKTFHFYFFDPENNNSYIDGYTQGMLYLAGFQIGPGRKLFTNEDIYDFQIGDRFHYKGTYDWPNTMYEFQNGPSDHYKIKRTVTGILSTQTEIQYSFLDSIEYNQEINFNYQNGYGGVYQTSYSYGTTYLKKPANKGYILPFQTPKDSFLNSGLGQLRLTRLVYQGPWSNSLLNKNYRAMFTCNTYLDTAYKYAGCYFAIRESRDYIEMPGLGTIYSNVGTSTTMGPNIHQTTLVYYKKGNNTWGTPIFLSDIEETKRVSNLSIKPNPTNSIVNVEIADNKAYKIKLLNSIGQSMISEHTFITKTTIDLSTKPAGIYLLILEAPDGKREYYKIEKH